VRSVGVSFASTYFDRPKELKELEDVLYNTWVKKDFEDLGLHYIPGFGPFLPPHKIVRMVLHEMKDGWTPQEIAEWFSQTNSDIDSDDPEDGEYTNREATELKLIQAIVNAHFGKMIFSAAHLGDLRPLADPGVMGQALFILGYQLIMSPNKFQHDLGEYIFKIAVLMRNRDATLHSLVSAQRRNGAAEPHPQAFLTLNSLVEEGTDIEAMCLRAEMLRWPRKSQPVSAAHRLQAYDLAVKAFNMSQAGPPIPPRPPPRVAEPVARVPAAPTLPAWLILQRMGGSDGTGLPTSEYPVWQKAIHAGASEYDDPEACLLAIDPASAIIPVGSPSWITFATKAAMAGKPNASLLLGQYYLELHGWYPPPKKATSSWLNKKRDRIGFHWVEVSISQMLQPPEIQVNAFLMALLLRANGDINGAVRWVDIGAERIEEVARLKSADARECAKARRFFEECRREDWGAPREELPGDWEVERWYFPEKLVTGNAKKVEK
jgi:hypothetical protein